MMGVVLLGGLMLDRRREGLGWGLDFGLGVVREIGEGGGMGLGRY